ncbi:MAG: DNA cytosine methyltransferase, partial [Rhodospirillales bacterium]
MKHLDLFSGIGGFALAARRVGWDTVGFCEIDPYCQKVLAKHWPGVPIYEDVTKLDGTKVGPVDIITGGFPCQDISVAGKQVGIDGERSGLWSELARIIGEVRPRYAVLENVAALLSGDSGRWFQRVLGDLAEIGYDCEWHCIPASSIGAPHRRDRVWVIAYPGGLRMGEFTGGRDLSNEKQHSAKEKQGRNEFTTGVTTDGERKLVADTKKLQRNGSDDNAGISAQQQAISQS